MISDGLRTYTRIAAWQIWLLWTSLAAGLLGLAYVTLFLPILAWRRRGFLVQPASIAPLLLFAGAGLMALQPFEQLGDRTAGSFLLLIASINLPIGAVVQAALALRRRYRWWSWDVAAGAMLLQWSVVLGSMEVLPLRLWW